MPANRGSSLGGNGSMVDSGDGGKASTGRGKRIEGKSADMKMVHGSENRRFNPFLGRPESRVCILLYPQKPSLKFTEVALSRTPRLALIWSRAP